MITAINYPDNTLLFQKRLQKQIVSFRRPDRSRLVTVTSETQAKVLLTLTNFKGKSTPTQPHSSLSSCTPRQTALSTTEIGQIVEKTRLPVDNSAISIQC